MELDKWLESVRTQRPLVHNITNLVVNNIAANALLSIGASPVMAYAREEVADMARISHGLSLNMGTLTPDVVESMLLAGKAANDAFVPIVFDPVGVGATPYRNTIATKIAEDLKLTVLRGNSGEMSMFLGLEAAVKGVDSITANDALPSTMKEYARKTQTVLVATGAKDYVSDGESIWRLSNGDPLLAAITGSGCILTALIGAFIAVVPKGSPTTIFAEACVAAISSYNIAAELAAKMSHGPGTFHAHLFDSLYNLDSKTVQQNAKVEQIEV